MKKYLIIFSILIFLISGCAAVRPKKGTFSDLAEKTHGSLSYTTSQVDTYLGYVAESSAFGRSIWSLADEAALQALINLEIGVDVQAYDADLTSLASGFSGLINGLGNGNGYEVADLSDFPTTGTWSPTGTIDLSGSTLTLDHSYYYQASTIEGLIDTYLDGSSDALQGFSLYDGDSNKATFSMPDLSGDITITFPSSTGTLQTAQTTFSGYGISDTLSNLETALGINDIAQLNQNETVGGYWSNRVLRMTPAEGALGSIATGDIIRDDGTYDPWGASLGVSGFGMKTTTGYALWGDVTGKFYWDNIVLSSGNENDIVTLDDNKQIQASSPAIVLGVLKDADAGIWQHVVVPIGSINPDGTYCAAWAEDPGTAGYRSMASACSGADDGYLRFTIPMPENWDGADSASELKIGIWWWISAEADPDDNDTVIWDAKVAPVDMHEVPGTDVTWTQAAADTYTILDTDAQFELFYSEIDVDSAVSGSGGDLLFVSIWNDATNESYKEPKSVLGITIYYKIDDLDSMD